MRKLKLTILSLSVVTVMAGAAVGPALGVIAAYFDTADPLLIQMIITLPSLLIILVSLIFSVLSARFSAKALALAGLSLYILGGSGAAFMDSIYGILACRIVLGIGVGLIMPLSTGLIVYHFTREEQARLMGYSSAMNSLGGIIASALAGVLVSLHWRYSFAIYLLGLIVVVLVMLSLPRTQLSTRRNPLPKAVLRTVLPYVLAMFVLMIAFFTVPASFAIIAVNENLMPASLVGAMLALMNVAAMLTGMFLPAILHVTRRYAMYFAVVMLLLGFGCLSIPGGVALVIIGLSLVGVGLGTFLPVLNTQVALRVGREDIASAMALMSAMLYLGQFLSPMIMDGLQNALGLQASRAPFILSLLLIAGLLLAMVKVPVTSGERGI